MRTTEELLKENDILRGIVAKIMPCIYCGADEMAKCPYGFPGCSLADDFFVAEGTSGSSYRLMQKKLQEYEKKLNEINELCKAALTKSEYLQNKFLSS